MPLRRSAWGLAARNVPYWEMSPAPDLHRRGCAILGAGRRSRGLRRAWMLPYWELEDRAVVEHPGARHDLAPAVRDAPSKLMRFNDLSCVLQARARRTAHKPRSPSPTMTTGERLRSHPLSSNAIWIGKDHFHGLFGSC